MVKIEKVKILSIKEKNMPICTKLGIQWILQVACSIVSRSRLKSHVSFPKSAP